MNTVKSFEDACKALNLNPEHVPDVSLIPERLRKAIVANFKLSIIAQALNEGWQPNWNDHSEYKYFPWFEIQASKEQPSGFGFSITGYGIWSTHSFVGSRLCFKSSELALYAGKQFAELYKDEILM